MMRVTGLRLFLVRQSENKKRGGVLPNVILRFRPIQRSSRFDQRTASGIDGHILLGVHRKTNRWRRYAAAGVERPQFLPCLVIQGEGVSFDVTAKNQAASRRQERRGVEESSREAPHFLPGQRIESTNIRHRIGIQLLLAEAAPKAGAFLYHILPLRGEVRAHLQRRRVPQAGKGAVSGVISISAALGSGT